MQRTYYICHRYTAAVDALTTFVSDTRPPWMHRKTFLRYKAAVKITLSIRKTKPAETSEISIIAHMQGLEEVNDKI